jgi:DNA-directed RNA polymerase II subunit RPB1
LRYILEDKITIKVECREEQEAGEDKKREIKPEEILNIFKGISPKDCEIMGFDQNRSRPDWMLIQNLPVPPPAVRPTITMDSTMKQDDDLTYQYRQIVKDNEELIRNNAKSRAAHTTENVLKLLQFHLATLIDNDLPGMPISAHKSGKKIKALRARLKGKEGRIRQNLMGKRVDFSARSVITPDPSLSLDQLGVPRSIAMNMTIPEVVSPLNIDRLRRLVENGPYEWPGANYIIRDNKTRLSLRDPKKLTDAHLEYGYVVERHLMDDDYVVFNRQPSLHKMSMMGHRIKILPYSSFRLNLSVTTPYNADFDGDEMNMHVPQSYETKAEVKEIMHVPKQIVSPQFNKPVMGLVQDTLMAMRLITSKDTFIEKDILMNLLMCIDTFDGHIPIPAILKPKPLWTGKQLISLLLPDVNLERLSASHDSDFIYDTPINIMDTKVLIQRGQLLMGGLCKKTVGNAAGGLVHIIWSDHGPDKCRRFLSTAQVVVNSWLVYHGFTVGVADTISGYETSIEIGKILKNSMQEVRKIMADAQDGKLECQPGQNMIETFETKMNMELNKARDKAGKEAMKNLSNENNIKTMVMAGSKGSSINISQIMSCVGQQDVEGKRIPFGFDRRTLPHFTKDDYGPESRGFVSNSYLSGLTPQEFFFHAMGGREGLIDTAVKTSETGYIQRRLMKSLEDVMVRYDGTTRNSMGHILQFLYGEDGMAGEYIEDQKIAILSKNDSEMKKAFQLIDPENSLVDELAKLKKVLEPEIVEEIADSMEMQIMLQKHFDEMMQFRNKLRTEVFKPDDDKQHLPVNLSRFITTAERKFHRDNKVSDLHPCKVLEALDNLIKHLIVVRGDDRVSKEAQANCIELFSIHLKSELAPKKLIVKDKLSKEGFEWVIGEIENRFNRSIISPGEVVGSIGAQSIGEPATQMTLNTFHYAGVASMNVTLGVPRLKEVINVAKTMRTPSMNIYLKSDMNDGKQAKKIQAQLEHTTLNQVVSTVQILYDPDRMRSIVAKDNEMLALYYQFENTEKLEDVSPWVIRMVLSGDKMTDKDLKVTEIHKTIVENYRKTLEVITSDDNADDLVIRIRTLNIKDEGENTQDTYLSLNQLKSLQENIMNLLLIKGIPEIKKVYMRQIDKPTYKENGELDRKQKEWLLETDGVNLKEVLAHESIDHTRAFSNNIVEIVDILGIEAVRQAILRELRRVLGAYGIYVNYRHIAMLADLMTHNGKLTSITRHGINRIENGPLRRCSFEETVEILLEAAAFAEVDHIRGVTENIMIGQLCPIGTGCFDVLIDKDVLIQAKYISSIEQTREAEPEDYFSTPMSNSPTGNTPFYSTPAGGSGMTPGATPGTSFPHLGRDFTPAYNAAVGSPVYADEGDLSGHNQYDPVSPQHDLGAAAYSQSPIYSPEHGAAPGIIPPNLMMGRPSSTPSALSRPAYQSPLYSPSGNFIFLISCRVVTSV